MRTILFSDEIKDNNHRNVLVHQNNYMIIRNFVTDACYVMHKVVDRIGKRSKTISKQMNLSSSYIDVQYLVYGRNLSTGMFYLLMDGYEDEIPSKTNRYFLQRLLSDADSRGMLYQLMFLNNVDDLRSELEDLNWYTDWIISMIAENRVPKIDFWVGKNSIERLPLQ